MDEDEDLPSALEPEVESSEDGQAEGSNAAESETEEQASKQNKDPDEFAKRRMEVQELLSNKDAQVPSWKPPRSFRKVGFENGQVGFENGQDTELDYDAIVEDDDVEIWAFRLPANLKARHLEGVKIAIQPNANGQVAQFPVRHVPHEIVALAEGSSGEMASFTPMLPRRTRKKVCPSTKAVTKRFSVRQAMPTAPAVALATQSGPTHHQPDNFTFEYLPYGSQQGSSAAQKRHTVHQPQSPSKHRKT